eukprot:NODE_613_length_5385_cov_1.452138.p1 type:complete len:282 gc:universal NODE_613_length_5385_cov_1.452138:1493-648(-)
MILHLLNKWQLFLIIFETQQMPSFFVSLPGTKDILGLIKSCNESGQSHDFKVPNFKVGTFDDLIQSVDELLNKDKQVESIVNKVIDTLTSLSNHPIVTIDNKPILDYIKDFEWNSLRFNINQPILTILNTIMTDINTIDNTLKVKLAQYNQLNNSVTQLNRKMTGTLLTRHLGNIIQKSDFILGSEYLQTELIVINNQLEQEWLNTYETISEMVVPRSTKKIAQDTDYCLYSVVVFKKFRDQFAAKIKGKYALREIQGELTDNVSAELKNQELQLKEIWVI